MINWDKPIQAMDGRKAIVCRAVISRSGEGAKVVYVSPPPGEVFGEVFLIDEKGFRCDGSAPEEPMQIIRNAPVKREGWINIYPNDCTSNIIYRTKEDAERSSEKIATIKIEWEE